MHLKREQLEDLVVEVMRQHFGNTLIERHRVIDVVEQQIRQNGAWEASDDASSRSVDPKSKGRAQIDYAISALKREDRLANPARNMWRVP